MGLRPTTIELEKEMHETIGAFEMVLISRHNVHRRDHDVVKCSLQNAATPLRASVRCSTCVSAVSFSSSLFEMSSRCNYPLQTRDTHPTLAVVVCAGCVNRRPLETQATRCACSEHRLLKAVMLAEAFVRLWPVPSYGLA